jgi:hypothetical protein
MRVVYEIASGGTVGPLDEWIDEVTGPLGLRSTHNDSEPNSSYYMHMHSSSFSGSKVRVTESA